MNIFSGSGATNYEALRKKSKSGSNGLIERKRNERQAAKVHTDGRKLRATGRTEQINTRFRPGFKARILAIAAAENIVMAEVLERGVELLEKQLKDKG